MGYIGKGIQSLAGKYVWSINGSDSAVMLKTVGGQSIIGVGDIAITTGHGTLTGLASDDHTQYHNDARGDARYYTQTLLDGGQLDTRYFTETEVTNALALKLALAGGTMTGAITSLRETKVTMAANDINLAAGNLFTKTITVATTFTRSNVPATGQATSFILELTNGGAFTITWFTGIKWAGGTAPTLTAAGVDILGFYSHDGGTTWRGMVLAKDSK